MAVLESLSTLGIREGELISFMVSKMNINQPKKSTELTSLPIQPFVFITTVLLLALGSLKKISIPEPGQALHKGVPCNGCSLKHIVGWRYKCGHCPGEVDFDEKCVAKHLAEHPDHVMLVIQEPLPPLPLSQLKVHKTATDQLSQAIIPPLEFEDETTEQS
jgi:hypothetical protein